MNIALIKKDSTKINAFKIDSIHNDSAALESITQVKCDTIIRGKEFSDNIDNNNIWSGLDISIITSIIIFFLGFVISEFIRRRNKSNELNQYKQFIKEWVNKSNNTLTDYIESLKKFSNSMKTNTDFNIAQWKTGIIHLTRINSIPLEKYSDIYIFGLSNKINDENRKNLMNFLYQLEYIDKAPVLLMDVYNKYCKENEAVMNEWNLSYIQLVDLFQIHNNINPNSEDGKVFLKIMHLFIPLLQETIGGNIITTDEWDSKFIKPAMKILSSNECSSSLLFQTIKLIKGLDLAIIKHKKVNEFHVIFDSYAASLDKAKVIINESINYFETKKIKKLCK